MSASAPLLGRWPPALAGSVVVVTFGVAVGTLGGMFQTAGFALAGGVILVIGATVRPVFAVALAPASLALGNRTLPGLPYPVQLVQIAAALCLAAVGLHMLLNGTKGYTLPRRGKGPALAAGAFVLANWVAALGGTTPGISASITLSLTLAALVAVATVIVVRNEGQLRLLLSIIVAGSIAVTAQAFAQAGSVAPVLGGAVISNRPVGPFADPNELGVYSMIALVLAITLVVISRSWRLRLVGVAAAGSAAGALLLSFSRGSWIAATVAVAVLVVMHPPARRPVLLLLGVSLLAGFALAAVGSMSVPVNAIWERATSLVEGQRNPYDRRPLIWLEAIRLFWERPFLGWGPGSFIELSAVPPSRIYADPAVHAHNAVLTIAAESGVVGVVTALVLAVLVVRNLVAGMATSDGHGALEFAAVRSGLLAVLCGIGAHLSVDYTLRNPAILLMVWVMIGMAAAAGADDSRSAADLPPVERDHGMGLSAQPRGVSDG